jgi:preprotein translocase subunit YajC
MKRLTPSIAAAIALLAVPASSAAAQTQRGAVLRVDRSHHRVEVVDARHAVRSYAAPRAAARKLRAGAKVSFQSSGGRISALRVNGRAHKLSFYAKVVSKRAGAATVRLGDGNELRLAARQPGHRRHHAHRGSVQINLQGLQPGQVVLITETIDRAGNVTITIKLVPNADPNGDDQDATGTITAIDASSVTIQTAAGQSMTFQASSDVLDGFEVDDQVDVTYYAEGDGTLVADDIEPADDGSADDGTDDLDAIGTVTALDADTITIQVDGAGPMTFAADSDTTDGIEVGDHVDVSYYQDDDGSLVADDVELTDDGSGDE